MAPQSREEGGKGFEKLGSEGGNTSEKNLRQGSLGFENQQEDPDLAEIPRTIYPDTWQVRELCRRAREPRIQRLFEELRRGDRMRLVVSTMHIYELVRGVTASEHARAAEEAALTLDRCDPLFTATVPSQVLQEEVAAACFDVMRISHEVTPALRTATTFQEAVSSRPHVPMMIGPGTYRTVQDAVRGFIDHPDSLSRVRDLQAKWLCAAQEITDLLRSEGVTGSGDLFDTMLRSGFLARSGKLAATVRSIASRHLPTQTPSGLSLSTSETTRCLDQITLGSCPTLAVELRLLARRVADRDAVFEESFVVDGMHASVGLPYCDYFAADTRVAEYLRDTRFPFRTANVYRSTEALLDLVAPP